MMRVPLIRLLLIVSLGLIGTGCETTQTSETSPNSKSNLAPAQPVMLIPLADNLALRSLEASSLAWYGDYLIILPQYPNGFSLSEDGLVFAISKESILAHLEGGSDTAIIPLEIPFVDQGIADRISGFEGFEAIAFQGDRAFLTIESKSGKSMVGFLVAADLSSDLSALRLNAGTLQQLPSQSHIMNMSDEALLVVNKKILTIHEANGANVNPNPVARVFGLSLKPLGTIPFPTLEYRVTDATCPDSRGRFWVINYFFPQEGPQLKPAPDIFDSKSGATHSAGNGIERLVELQYSQRDITPTDTKPVYLKMGEHQQPRNWEGLVRLEDRGFLIVTDRFPDTLLGFVPWSSG